MAFDARAGSEIKEAPKNIDETAIFFHFVLLFSLFRLSSTGDFFLITIIACVLLSTALWLSAFIEYSRKFAESGLL